MNITFNLSVPDAESAQLLSHLITLVAPKPVDVSSTTAPARPVEVQAAFELEEKPARKKRRTKAEIKAAADSKVVSEQSDEPWDEPVPDAAPTITPRMTYPELMEYIQSKYINIKPTGKSERTKKLREYMYSLYSKEIMLTDVNCEDYARVIQAVDAMISDLDTKAETADDSWM